MTESSRRGAAVTSAQPRGQVVVFPQPRVPGWAV